MTELAMRWNDDFWTIDNLWHKDKLDIEETMGGGLIISNNTEDERRGMKVNGTVNHKLQAGLVEFEEILSTTIRMLLAS